MMMRAVRIHRDYKRHGLLLVLVLAGTAGAGAQNQDPTPDYSLLSLQELSQVKVTSVSMTPETLSRSAAAVYVISQEEIHRSGMTNIADLLRLVPGLSVARLGGSQWAVTSRGFNGRFANKLLVLVDGRSIYTPIFSGVYWDMCMPLLDDIQRIEVIRGPGASVWGANAVDGVINIITKSSTETKGGSIVAGGGTAERAFGELRVSGKFSDNITYRGYLSGHDRSALQTPGGADAHDGWSDEQGGFRIDGVTKNGGWRLEGDIFQSRREEVSNLVLTAEGTQGISDASFPGMASDLAFEWRRKVTESSDLRITTYYDSMNRPETGISTERTRTGDFEIQYHFVAKKNHEISVGLTDRLVAETVVGSNMLWFTPDQVTYQLASGFAQDEIHLLNDRVLVTLGIKVDHSLFGGWQPQPTARILWAPNKRHSAWFSFSDASRTPSFYERNITAFTNAPSPGPFGLLVYPTLSGSPQFQVEDLRATEVGYRAQPSARFSLDLTAFYHDHDNMRSADPGDLIFVSGAKPYFLAPFYFGNLAEGEAMGAEAAWMYRPAKQWRLAGSYGYFHLNQRLLNGAPAGSFIYGQTAFPTNQLKVESFWDVSKKIQFDALALTSSSVFNMWQVLPSHTRIDLRLGWRISPAVEISLSGQDLLSARHLELTPEAFTFPTDAVRGYYLRTTWRF